MEFALLLIPLLILCFGLVEYGRAVYQYNTLAKAVRDGVRHAAQGYPSEEAKCLVVFGRPDCNDPALVPLVPNLTLANVDVQSYTDVPTSLTTTGIINIVEIKIINFSFPLIGLPFLGTNSDSILFGPISAFMRQM